MTTAIARAQICMKCLRSYPSADMYAGSGECQACHWGGVWIDRRTEHEFAGFAVVGNRMAWREKDLEGWHLVTSPTPSEEIRKGVVVQLWWLGLDPPNGAAGVTYDYSDVFVRDADVEAIKDRRWPVILRCLSD